MQRKLTKMSKKDERFNRVDELLLQGSLSEEDIIAHIADEFGVKPATVEKDIETLKAQSEPLPFGDEDEDNLLEELLSNRADANGADLSALTYDVPKGEEKFVHALIEIPTYSNTVPPTKESTPRIQKFAPQSWINFGTYHRAQGYVVHKVLHLPKGAKAIEEIDIFGATRKA